MIVSYQKTGWEIVTQRSHGILAAQLAMHWKHSERPQKWVETILAIGEHDDAEVELDGENLLTPQGGPLDFSMKTFEVAHAKKSMMFATIKSRYIALLTSMHINFLYGKEADTNPEAKVFLQEQATLQSDLLKQLNLSKQEADRAYDLLEWCDAFSLLLCQRQLQPEHRGVEISRGPEKIKYSLYQLDENLLTINPWPFETKAFEIFFESRMIEQLHFTNSASFRKAFYAAGVKDITFKLENKNIPDKKQKV